MTRRLVVATSRFVAFSLLVLWIAASLRLGPYVMTGGEILAGWIAMVAGWQRSGMLVLTVVLIAVLQRPFWSWAGVRRHALQRSLIASVWGVPFFLPSLFFFPGPGGEGELCLATFALPIWTLIHVACARTCDWTDGGEVNWRILLLSNVTVALGMFLMTAVMDALRPQRWRDVGFLTDPPWQELRWGSFAVLSVLAAVAIVAAFSLPYRDEPRKSVDHDANPGSSERSQ